MFLKNISKCNDTRYVTLATVYLQQLNEINIKQLKIELKPFPRQFCIGELATVLSQLSNRPLIINHDDWGPRHNV